jgi:hypothetical protein
VNRVMAPAIVPGPFFVARTFVQPTQSDADANDGSNNTKQQRCDAHEPWCVLGPSWRRAAPPTVWSSWINPHVPTMQLNVSSEVRRVGRRLAAESS